MDLAFIDFEVAGTRDPGAHLSAAAAQNSSNADSPLVGEQSALSTESEGRVEAARGERAIGSGSLLWSRLG